MAELDVPFGEGSVDLADDGTVVAVRHPERPGMTYLLDEAAEDWHTSEHRWGKGFVITDAGAARWDAPTELDVTRGGDGLVARAGHALASGLVLDVERRIGGTWTESYVVRNEGDRPRELRTVGVYAPLRDVCHSAADALQRAVLAHVWTGGSDAWVVAQPMDGGGPVLALHTTAGALWAYSIESRELPAGGSDARGHIVLHPTDAARAPHAFGGQPVIELAPGTDCELAWELAWHPSAEAFFAAHPPLVDVSELGTEVGCTLSLTLRKPGVTVIPPAGVERQAADDGRTVRLRSAHEGERYVELECDGRRSRVALQWHAPLPEIVRRRARYVLDHQRAPHRPGAAAGALVPIDTETGLTVPGAGWNDFSDARERIGMGLFLQQVLAHGWGDDRDEVADAVARYRRFLFELVITDDGRARSSSHGRAASDRLYDLPWLMLFLLGGDTAAEDVERAKTMFDRYHADGGDTFLAIGIGVAARELVAGLRRQGRRADADAVAERLIAHARGVLDLDAELPAHEVAYEQSIVAPLLEIFCVAAELTDDEAERGRLTDAIVARLPWLLAFGGRQPHVRMRDIAIRHWDGYWFGRERLWGDVFPHHWSALTANVLMLLPPAGADEVERRHRCSAQRLAARIYAANVIDFRPDGAATAAFVMPSCVSGRPAHRADPIANDQDWALYWPLFFSADLSAV